MRFLATLLGTLVLAATTIGVRAESPDTINTQADGIVETVVFGMSEQSEAYFHLGDYPRIVDIDRTIVAASPHDVDIFETGGWIMDSLKRYNDAEAFYQMGVLKNPHSAPMYYSLGMFYYNTLHDYSAAVVTYKTEIENCPGADINDWKMLAHSYERNGQLGYAVAIWLEAKKRWPNGGAVQSNLTRTMQLWESRSGHGKLPHLRLTD